MWILTFLCISQKYIAAWMTTFGFFLLILSIDSITDCLTSGLLSSKESNSAPIIAKNKYSGHLSLQTFIKMFNGKIVFLTISWQLLVAYNIVCLPGNSELTLLSSSELMLLSSLELFLLSSSELSLLSFMLISYKYYV